MIALPLLFVSQVVLWHSYREGEQRALEQAVVMWNTAHPDVQVTPIAIPNEGFTAKLQATVPRGHGPDAWIAAHDTIGESTRLGMLSILDEGPGEGSIDTSAFLDATVSPLRVGGHLYGVPLAFKSAALYYRTDLVEHPPRTTDELRALCRRLVAAAAHAGDPSRTCLVYEAGNFYYQAAWLHGYGGRILDGDGPDARPRLATPEGAAALRFVRSLVDEHLIPDETTGTVVSELFNDGRAAMAMNGPAFLGEIKPGVPFGVAPLPSVSETGRAAAPLYTVEAGMIPPQAKNRAGALAFLRWLAGPEASLVRALAGKQTIACKATWADPRVARDPILGAFRAQLDATVAMSSSPGMGVTWEPANFALRRVLRGAAEPEAALREADRRIDLALRPPPPAEPRAPYLVAIGGLLTLGGFVVVRRSRAVVQRTKSDRGAWAWLGPAALAVGVLVFVPFAVGAGMSLYHSDGVAWRFIGLGNFTAILTSRDQPITDPLSFYVTLLVTALWTLCNVTLHVVLGVSLALALRDPLLKLRGTYRVLLIVPWAIPNYITALIWKGMFHRQLGAVNGLLVLLGFEPVSWFARFSTAFTANLTTNVWLGFPFMMVTTLGCLSRIPKELEEAASLDGAGRLQRLRHIILPLLRPALLPSVILGAVWTFNMFNVVFLVSGGEPDGATDILISQAYRFAFTRGHQYGYAAAYAVLIFAVLVGQSVLARRLSSRTDGEGGDDA